jgi:hypothetical protein
MTIAIAGIGLAVGQSNSPAELPWESKWNVSRICYRALDSSLFGAARWQALVQKAFADLGSATRATPLFVGSCNGDASTNWEQAFHTGVLLEDTPWANEGLPVFSSSCASGLHALYAAKQLVNAGAIDEALVLAADILSQSNHENFESLRVLAEQPSAPWQSASQGFILGEAAVVLKLTRAGEGNRLSGPELASDLAENDGLSSVIEAISPQSPSLIIGQGTGPYENDNAELFAFSTHVDKAVPIATPLSHFGHTLGASGLLSIALAALSRQSESEISFLTERNVKAMDGRPLLCRGGTPWPPVLQVLATCRALNGACAATMVGDDLPTKAQRRKGSWRKSVTSGPLMNPTLRRLSAEALEHRPADPPDVLILRMEKPLSPPASAIIGGRLLPSAVLEITPGFASQLIARCWGFSGPALCLVGDVDHDVYGLRHALLESGSDVFQVNLRGSENNRVIEWNV